MDITDFPVGGFRHYDTLECLSDVPYRGIMVKAYWKYTDPITLREYKVDDIHYKVRPNCRSPDIGWRSTRGIYKKDTSFYSLLRLGRFSENATVGLFTCHIEGDRDSPVSVTIGESKDKIYLSFFIENI